MESTQLHAPENLSKYYYYFSSLFQFLVFFFLNRVVPNRTQTGLCKVHWWCGRFVSCVYFKLGYMNPRKKLPPLPLLILTYQNIKFTAS